MVTSKTLMHNSGFGYSFGWTSLTDSSETDGILQTFLYVVIPFLVVLLWYYWPRFQMKDIPKAPSTSWFRGHLYDISRLGFSNAILTWKSKLKHTLNGEVPPIFVYYRGRTPIVIATDPETTRLILKSSSNRSIADLFYKPPSGGLNASNGVFWRVLRRQTMPILHNYTKISTSQFEMIADRVKKQLLLNFKDEGLKSVDFMSVMRSYCLDAMVMLLLNVDLNTLEGQNQDVMNDVNRITWWQLQLQENALVTWIVSILKPPVAALVPFSEFLASFVGIGKDSPKSLENVVVASIRDRLAKTSSKGSGTLGLLDCFLSRGGKDLARANLFPMIIASVDNIGVTLAIFFYFMAKNPTVTDRLRSELLLKSTPPSKCEYLEWCLKETLRMLTPVPNFGRVMENDIVIRGGLARDEEYVIPKGTNCFVDLDSLHHDRSLWKDPECFRPERFDPSSNEFRERRGPSCGFYPFGSHTRVCAGQSVAKKLFMKILIGRLFEDGFYFDVDKSKMTDETITFQTGLAKYPVGGVHLLVRRIKEV